MFSNISDAVPHAESGAIRLLAVSTNSRAPQLPNVQRCGIRLPWLQRDYLNGLMAPSGTHATSLEGCTAIRKAAGDPIFARRLDGYGAAPLGNTPEDFRQ